MLIEKRSIATGRVHILDLPVTKQQVEAWQGGELIQNAMPDLSIEMREFIVSGITPWEWEELYGEEDEQN